MVGSLAGPQFIVLTYNLLADVCATEEQYSNCPSFALKWEDRRENLLKEILQGDVDIICLQELQQNHFIDFFYLELAKHGYEGIFKEKQREFYSPTVDGCATFYRRSHYRLLGISIDQFGRFRSIFSSFSERQHCAICNPFIQRNQSAFVYCKYTYTCKTKKQ